MAVFKLLMARVADKFGRLEAFVLSTGLYMIGYAQQAASRGLYAYAGAQVVAAAGLNGVQILIMIFLADTSSLQNRAICLAIPLLPFLVNVWIGPSLANFILTRLNWRWGYGIWVVLTPAAFLPLAVTLIKQRRKTQANNPSSSPSLDSYTLWTRTRRLCDELDMIGLLLMTMALAFLLVPATLAVRTKLSAPCLSVMISFGIVCLMAIPFWELNEVLAPRPIIPRSFWKDRTIIAGLILISFSYGE